jgi:hypothetical protein
MDWMKQHTIVIQCKEKSVVVTSPSGDRICVEVEVQAQPTATVNQLINSQVMSQFDLHRMPSTEKQQGLSSDQ